MAKAKFPTKMPGDFFVVVWSREAQRYIIHVDDAQRSDYAMGEDLTMLKVQLRSWGLDTQYIEDILDLAREFGACQAIPSERRAVQLLPPRQEAAMVFEDAEEQDNAWIGSLV